MNIEYDPEIHGENLLEIWKHAKDQNISKEELSRILGITYKTLDSRLYRANSKYNDAKPETFAYSIGDPWRLNGDWLIIGDVHAPFTDYDFAQLPAMIAKIYLRKPRRLLIAGDTFNMDAFSTYSDVIQMPTWKQERDGIRQLFSEWYEVFDEIWLLMGNHDRRMQKFTGAAFDESDILSLIGVRPDKTQYSPFGFCTIETQYGVYRVTHPRNYSINQLVVADQLAQKYQQHIISHHEHHVAMGYDRYKNFIIINNGCLADPNKFAYVVLDDSKSAGMEQSFVLLTEGYPRLLANEPFTNWEALLGTRYKRKIV